MGLLDDGGVPTMPPANYSNFGTSASSDFYRFRIDATDILDEIQHQLRGEILVKDEDGNSKYVRKFTPDLNDEGIADVLNIIYSLGFNKSNILGNLSKEEIYDRCRTIWGKLAKYFVKEARRIGLSRSKRDMLIIKIVFLVHSALSRSEGGKEASQISTGTQRIEHSISNGEEKKGGLLGFLSPKKGQT